MEKVKIEIWLLLLLWGLSIIAILGVGYALGGGETQNAANYINGIIAFTGAISAITSMLTLLFIIVIRNDWKKPKMNDTALSFKLSIKHWEGEAISLLYSLCKFKDLPYEDFHKYYHFESNNESLAWSELERRFEKYQFYNLTYVDMEKVFLELKQVRRDLIFTAINYDSTIRETGSPPKVVHKNLSNIIYTVVSAVRSQIQLRN
ncbi:hypothetical protein ACU5EH_00615 [Aliivibrio salmonicida]|uniref:hypothetical protein n=1 Tax=Aliivibrio salmonicida TaxID=40269 RepID=UPI00406D2DDC